FRGLFELRADLLERAVETAEKATEVRAEGAADGAKRAANPDVRILARALVAKARVTLEIGKMGDAEAELRRALDLAGQAKDDVTRAEATRSLGWALTAMSRFD